jgi:hypothetical protein
MFGLLRRVMRVAGITTKGRVRRPRSSAQRSAVGDVQAQRAQEHLRDKNYRHPHTESDINFEKKFDASDAELNRARELNESDLYSDGSSEYSRLDAHRQDGGATETLTYPHTPNLGGKGAQSPEPKRKRRRKAA